MSSLITQARRNMAATVLTSGLSLTSMRRRGRIGGPLARQDKYILSIDLSTNHTGKHFITINPADINRYFVLGGMGPQPSNILTLRRESFTGHNPYDSKTFLMGKTPEWDALNKKIKLKLDELFKPDTIIRLPNPNYNEDRVKDSTFKVSSYVWTENKNKPSWMGNYKFSIRYTPDNKLEVPVSVKVYGKFLTKKEIKNTSLISKKIRKKPNTMNGKINSACDYHMKSFKNIISGYSSSNNFEKKVKRMYSTHNIRRAVARVSPPGPPIILTVPRWKGGTKHKRLKNRTKRKNQKNRTKRKKKRIKHKKKTNKKQN